MVSERKASWIVLAGLILALHVACPGLYLSGSGRVVPDGPGLALAPLVLGAFVAAPVLLVAGLLSLRRSAGATTRRVAGLSALWCVCTVLAVSLTPDRRAAFVADLATRADPLAQAIEAHQRAQGGRPPATLEELVPATLPALPDLGLPQPWIQYSTAPAGETWPAPGWRLRILLPRSGFIASADMLVYVQRGTAAPTRGHAVGHWHLVPD